MDNNILLELFLHVKYSPYKMYMVGGCVRDHILHRKVKDIDLVTDFPIMELEKVLLCNGWQIKNVGKNFLVTIASKNGYTFEIANFRKDGCYLNGRSPESVSIGTIEEDCHRRDLTINSLYYEPFSDTVIDILGIGIKDINDGIIRMIGNPKDRIEEDNLRILRVYRFASRYGLLTVD